MNKPSSALIQYILPGDPTPRLGIQADGEVRRLPPQITAATMMELLENWDAYASVLESLDTSVLEPVHDAALVAPLTFPHKVICAGVNYYDHAQEMGTARPDSEADPFFFLKTPTTTIVGPYDDIQLPGNPASKVDWEAELAVVVGKTCKNASAEDALSYVAGYTVANDLSDRGLFPRAGAVFPAFSFDWFAHKSQDGFCPIGPGVVPSWLVKDPQTLAVQLFVNDELKQDGNTRDMVITIAKLVAAASRLLTLQPGDLILTGTPAGVGMPKGTFLKADDVVRVEIEGIGSIRNRMIGK
ncbi:fumarylacetoacetate hydrolase family protein [Arthrobacter sp. CDRTa11]|uniref:fumarylacetoacetate hydrolase family protein n=1 Tax=Arthrobacter sp. CDRTa11 TaxID=2651199 RepID=UPI002265BA3A|nr:fumarylacetoacetate hydrolase family protein [Arthrobacter sp. CDRTa11]UZX03042.1 fumarylacetoacetate hydrolase family protein [Arthrobacter sp. CDRTa11]